MKIEEYLESLPQSVLSGNDIQLPDHTFEEMFELIGLDKDDVFCHLGCGDGSGIAIAIEKFKVKKAIGVDISQDKIQQANKKLKHVDSDRFTLECMDVRKADISKATTILFWFTDIEIITDMMERFEKQTSVKIITLWGPLPECIPDTVEFPFIVCATPFNKTKDMKKQISKVFGVDCIDFVTAWEFAQRYTKAIEPLDAQNDRFLTILQTINIWINAWNMGVACGKEIPLPIKTYIGILKEHFGIEVEHLLKNESTED